MANKTWQQSSHSNFVRGAFYGLAAVSIWAAFIVVSRFGVRRASRHGTSRQFALARQVCSCCRTS